MAVFMESARRFSVGSAESLVYECVEAEQSWKVVWFGVWSGG